MWFSQGFKGKPKSITISQDGAKAIADVSWSEFDRHLEYKCRWNFKHYIKIGRFEPTSKTCSSCGHVQEMPLSKRMS